MESPAGLPQLQNVNKNQYRKIDGPLQTGLPSPERSRSESFVIFCYVSGFQCVFSLISLR